MMAANNSPATSTFTFNFCENTMFKGTKTIVVRGHMSELSRFKRAKLLASESRVCIAYRQGQQLLVLKEDINSDVLYHYCPQLRNFYTCSKTTGPTILLPETEQFSLVSEAGIKWVIGSFMHEMSKGSSSFFTNYVRSKRNMDPKRLFHAAATFRAFGLPFVVEHLVLPGDGVIAHALRNVAWSIKTPKGVGEYMHHLKGDPLICEEDQALLAEAHKIFTRRMEGWTKKKPSA